MSIPLQRQIRHGIQMPGENHPPAAGCQICGNPESRRPQKCGAGGGHHEYATAPLDIEAVRCVRVQEDDVRRPRTVSDPILARAPSTVYCHRTSHIA